MRTEEVFKALADPTRRRLLKLLQGGSRTAGQLAAQVEVTKATLSHHFAVLKTADLVRCERRGQHVVYSLNSSVVEDAAVLLFDVLGVGRRARRLAHDPAPR